MVGLGKACQAHHWLPWEHRGVGRGSSVPLIVRHLQVSWPAAPEVGVVGLLVKRGHRDGRSPPGTRSLQPPTACLLLQVGPVTRQWRGCSQWTYSHCQHDPWMFSVGGSLIPGPLSSAVALDCGQTFLEKL